MRSPKELRPRAKYRNFEKWNCSLSIILNRPKKGVPIGRNYSNKFIMSSFESLLINVWFVESMLSIKVSFLFCSSYIFSSIEFLVINLYTCTILFLLFQTLPCILKIVVFCVLIVLHLLLFLYIGLAYRFRPCSCL